MYKKLKIQGLRQRWMINIVMPIFLILLLAFAIFSAGIANYYYRSVETNLSEKARAAAEWMDATEVGSYGEYFRAAAELTQTDSDKDRLELQFINAGGRIQASSYGVTTGSSPNTADIVNAMESGESASFRGSDPVTGESIIAVSAPLSFGERTVGVMRYVTSTVLIEKQIRMDMLIALGAVLGAMLLVFVASLLFINSVIRPVVDVSETAKRISAGSYGVQLENKYDGELGELVTNINDMSQKISQTEKMEQEFISSVSHELRTPLTAINGWVETMLGADEPMEQRDLQRGLGIIKKETGRLTNMVEELLEFSRMQDGRFTLRIAPIDLQAESEDTVYTYRSLFHQEGIAVNFEGCETEEVVPVSGDSERLRQVFCNLLDNAAKHGGSGKRIDTAFYLEEGYQCIRIRDYGPGIPEEELPFVKQKFYKGSSKARGSGIGLAVSDEIMRLHGAEFTIANAEGGGTVCTLRFPGGSEK